MSGNSRGGGFFRLLSILVIVGAGVLGYMCYSTGVWKNVTALLPQGSASAVPAPARPEAAPARPVVVAAKPASAPIVVPPPVPPAKPAPPSAPSLAKPDPLGWLAANAGKYSIQVTLTQDVTFPILLQGKVVGSGNVAAGNSVNLVSLDQAKHLATLSYPAYGNSTMTLPWAATDVVQRAGLLVDKAKADSAQPQDNGPLAPVSVSKIEAPPPRTTFDQRRHFVHPGAGLSLADLQMIKANLDKEPWASGYAQLKADGRSSLDYKEMGPFPFANRNNYGDYSHSWEWKSDMQAVYNLARMWYFTGDANYAQKAHDILLSWARTQKHYDGIEAAFDTGDYAYRYVGGAEILRGTWPGWTQEDTDTVKDYFGNVLLAGIATPVIQGSQGMEQFAVAVAVAAFDDDSDKFNQLLDAFLNDPDSGLSDTTSNGEVGDTGRDQGHTALYMFDLAWVAEVFWTQGIDVYSARDNRIRACLEYYSRFHAPGPRPAFVAFGTPFWGIFQDISGEPRGPRPAPMGFNIFDGAYVVRKNMQIPWAELLRGDLGEDEDSFMFRKTSDTSTAEPVDALPEPPCAPVTTGLISQDLNGCTPEGSASYSTGTWTLTGGYNGVDPWSPDLGNDSVHFAYTQVTGDFMVLAKVGSVSDSGSPDAKGGIMLRDSLQDASIRAWVGLTPDKRVQRAIRGWSSLPYGANAATLSCQVPQASYWVKMVRTGKRLALFSSPNGGDWSPSVVADFEKLPDAVYVGLFDCSFVTNSTNTATFTNVRLTGGDGNEGLPAPPAPFAIYASPGSGCVPLFWNQAYQAASYHVKRSNSKDGPFKTIATVSGTSYTDSQVANGATYYYAVSAVNAGGESGNSPVDAVTPQAPLVNVTGSGAVSASADSDEWGHPAKAAFDRNAGTKWMAPATDAWIQYDAGGERPPTIQAYAITSSEDVPERDPADWKLQGSNDGSSWTTLDTETGQKFTYRQQTLTFPLASPASYSSYRLTISANCGAPDVQLSEVALLAKPEEASRAGR